MGNHWKTTQIVLACLVIMLGGFWTSVTFLGENWSDQWHYALSLLNLLLLILFCAALLVGFIKLTALLWEKLVNTAAATNSDESPSQPDNRQE